MWGKHGFSAEDKGFEQPSKTAENRVVFQKRVINPTQEHAETLAELLKVAKQTRKPSKASGGR